MEKEKIALKVLKESGKDVWNVIPCVLAFSLLCKERYAMAVGIAISGVILLALVFECAKYIALLIRWRRRI